MRRRHLESSTWLARIVREVRVACGVGDLSALVSVRQSGRDMPNWDQVKEVPQSFALFNRSISAREK